MREPILITGAARSGTSLVAGVISLCGGWSGTVRGPNPWNKKGMFENNTITERMIKPLLAKVGADPLCQKPLPVTSQFQKMPIEFMSAWRESVLEIIKEQGYVDGPWFLKEPKISMTWYVWAKAFPEATWVLVRRAPEDIVKSCVKTSFMRAYKTSAGWLGWVAVHEKRFEEMHDARLRIYQVWPQRAIDGDYTELQAIVNNLGMDWDLDKVRSFVAPSLWHRTKKGEILEVKEGQGDGAESDT